MSETTIAVIGAGVAGAAAASMLAAAGRRVQVFDKSRGAGGRTGTRRVDGLRFDAGAAFLTLRGAVEERLGAALLEQSTLARWRGRFGEWRDGRFQDVALDPRWVGVPGMSQVARGLLGDLPVATRQRVTQVSRDGRVVLEDGSEHRFARVVVAVPAPQAVQLLPQGDVRATLSAVQVEPCWALRIAVDREPASLRSSDISGMRFATGPLAWLSREHTKPGRAARPAWVVHATSAWSSAHLEDDAGDVARVLVEAARDALGPWAAGHVEAHRWRFAEVTEPVGRPYLEDGAIAVCGDGLLGGRVGDALRSGLALGQAWGAAG